MTSADREASVRERDVIGDPITPETDDDDWRFEFARLLAARRLPRSTNLPLDLNGTWAATRSRTTGSGFADRHRRSRPIGFRSRAPTADRPVWTSNPRMEDPTPHGGRGAGDEPARLRGDPPRLPRQPPRTRGNPRRRRPRRPRFRRRPPRQPWFPDPAPCSCATDSASPTASSRTNTRTGTRPDPTQSISPTWEMTSGSLFASRVGWTGTPDDVAPNVGSTNGTNSAVFRLTTKRYRLRERGRRLLADQRRVDVHGDDPGRRLGWRPRPAPLPERAIALRRVAVNRRDGKSVRHEEEGARWSEQRRHVLHARDRAGRSRPVPCKAYAATVVTNTDGSVGTAVPRRRTRRAGDGRGNRWSANHACRSRRDPRGQRRVPVRRLHRHIDVAALAHIVGSGAVLDR